MNKEKTTSTLYFGNITLRALVYIATKTGNGLHFHYFATFNLNLVGQSTEFRDLQYSTPSSSFFTLFIIPLTQTRMHFQNKFQLSLAMVTCWCGEQLPAGGTSYSWLKKVDPTIPFMTARVFKEKYDGKF